MMAALAAAIDSVGSAQHVERLIDFIGSLVIHDRVTVVRYSHAERPEFVSYRNYSEAMVWKYLETYYVYDPFYAHWRKQQNPGVVRLQGKLREPYIAEFLGQSAISDEVGVLLQDGTGWCLGIFLDRSKGRFSNSDVLRLKTHFAVFASLHALDIKSRSPGFKRTSQPAQEGEEPKRRMLARVDPRLWPNLSKREQEVAQLILMGHPTAGIARKLQLAPGTVKNHRRNIYGKLDITTERELILQYIDRGSDESDS